MQSMRELSWQLRLAIVLSAIWLVVAATISIGDPNGTVAFLMLGALPIGFFWGGAWIWSGYRKQHVTAITLVPISSERIEEASIFSATFCRMVSIALTVSGLGIFYYAFTKTSVDPASKIGYLIGFYFWVPILVYVIWKDFFKKKKGVGILLLSASFLLISVYQSNSMLREAEEERQFLADAQNLMLKLMNGELVEREKLEDAGQYSPILFVLYDFLSGVFNDLKTLNTRFEKSGVAAMLSPQALGSPQQIEQSMKTLYELMAVVNHTEKKIAARYDEFPRQIDEANITTRIKAEFRTGAEAGIKIGRKSVAEFFVIERSLLETAVEMLGFMKEIQGQFKEKDGRLLFERQADLNKYNHYLHLIQALALKESEWRNRQLSTSAKEIELIGGQK